MVTYGYGAHRPDKRQVKVSPKSDRSSAQANVLGWVGERACDQAHTDIVGESQWVGTRVAKRL
jgi:hypothetical protein